MTVDSRLPEASVIAREAARVARLLMIDRAAACHRVKRGLGVLRAAILLRDCECGVLVNAQGHVRVVAGGRVSLGDRVQLCGGVISTELICHEGAELVIGAHALLSYGVSIEATRSVRIGDRCMFGSLVRIRDAAEDVVAPVVLEDDVWLAYGVIVEPGVTIGEGSVVSAGSVVRADVPRGSLCTGNPAVSVPLKPSRATLQREDWKI